MSTLTVTQKFHLARDSKGSKRLRQGPTPSPPPPKPSREARLLAYAIVFEDWLRNGVVKDYAEIAKVTGLDRSRVTRIMNLRLQEPERQEKAAIGMKVIVFTDSSCSRSFVCGHAPAGSLANSPRAE